jgi:hypothetical protein
MGLESLAGLGGAALGAGAGAGGGGALSSILPFLSSIMGAGAAPGAAGR